MSSELSDQIEAVMGLDQDNSPNGPVYEELRERFRDLAHYVNNTCPDSEIKTKAINRLGKVLVTSLRAAAGH